jgi:opacity protein-like surface antigen
MMKIFGVAAVIVLGGIGQAAAADLGNGKMSPVTQQYEDVSTGSWSGVYFGGHVGYGWNKHDITASEKEVTDGTAAHCDGDAVLNATDGKCYTSVDVPAVDPSCKDGATLKDGKCFVTVVDTPAIAPSCTDANNIVRDGACYTVVVDRPERCDGFGLKPYNGLCYDRKAFGEDGALYPNATPVADKYVAALTHEKLTDGYNPGVEAVVHEDEKPDAYNPGQAASTEVTEAPDALVPAVDAQTTITNTLLGLDPDGIFGGVRVGADFQPHGSRLVFGVFGDFNFASNDVTSPGGNVLTDENSYLLAGRLGALVNDKTLIYALAGYGWQDVAYDSDTDKTFGHMVAGAGFEYKLTKNLTAGIEAQHWFATKETIFDGPSMTVTDERSDTRVLARVNYRFGTE